MIEWKKVKIGDLCTRVTSGGTPKSTVSAYYDNGTIPWLNSKEVHFCSIYSTENKITERGLTESSAKWIERSSVIVAMYGATAGQVAVAKIPLTTNQACCNLTINKEVADYRYVYYWMFYQYNTLASMANGGAQQNLNAKIIKEFEIFLPTLQTQRYISDILSSLDDKIELNHKINQNLEAQAQAIFKSWFVDFEPFQNGKFIDSELGPIPEGWRVGRLDEIMFLNNEKKGASDAEIDTYISTENMLPDRGGIETASNKPNKGMVTTFGENDVLISNIRPYFKKIWYASFSGCCSTDVLCFRAKKAIRSEYVFCVLNDESFFSYMMSGAKGTKMPRGDKQQIISYRVILPPKEIVDSFADAVKHLFKKKRCNIEESLRLALSRDAILPKLMSGEINVSEIEA